jgi:hypothetical protein
MRVTFIILSYPNSYPTLTFVKANNKSNLMNPVIHYIPKLGIAITSCYYAVMR